MRWFEFVAEYAEPIFLLTLFGVVYLGTWLLSGTSACG